MAVAVTTTAEALDASEPGVDVTNTLGFPQSGDYTVRVDSEWMRVTGGQGTTTWTVTRGYNGTTAATHDNGASIFHVPDTFASLDRIKRRLALGATQTTANDAELVDFIDAVQSYMVGPQGVGMFLGPTTTTSIDMDGRLAARDPYTGRRSLLYVPFGIQSLTSVEVQPATGDTFETVTAADIVSRPREWEPRLDPNQPTTLLMMKDVVDGTWTAWPEGVGNVRITGTLGWSEPPNVIGEIADTLVIRMFHAATSGQRDLVGFDPESGDQIVSRFLSPRDNGVIRTFRAELSGHVSV